MFVIRQRNLKMHNLKTLNHSQGRVPLGQVMLRQLGKSKKLAIGLVYCSALSPFSSTSVCASGYNNA